MEDKLLQNINYPSDLRQIPVSDLPRIADELRRLLIDQVSKTGGHLGASLGVVELTVALHYVFDTPYDKLIWDVSHQAYPHKILTGRKKLMENIRQEGGISGFTKRSESEYDVFGAAHSSTSISAGLGIATAKRLKRENDRTVCVIGDGAMGAGMAYEALSNLGDKQENLTVILNDNAMSIGPAVGAISSHLAHLLSLGPIIDAKSLAKAFTAKMPKGLRKAASYMSNVAHDLVSPHNIFEALDLQYFGPVDGHKVTDLIQILKNLRNIKGPVLLHVITCKGKGYPPAEKADDKFHGVSSFNIATGATTKNSKAVTYTKVFGEALVKEAEKDNSIVAITAAMASGSGLVDFSKKFPDRFFDVGIAEQHAVTFAAGLATEGMKPFVAIYSTFLQRAYDQIVHDVALQKLPVRFAIDRAGLVGADGATHAGAFDIAYLGCLPNMVIMAPSDEEELARMVKTCLIIDDSPSSVRYPRGAGPQTKVGSNLKALKVGKAKLIKEGSKGAIINLGARLQEVKEVANKLSDKGIEVTVIDARFAKPLDEDMIKQVAQHHPWIVTVEEGSVGGFATQVMHLLANKYLLSRTGFLPLVLPDRFIDHADVNRQYQVASLDVDNILQRIEKFIDHLAR